MALAIRNDLHRVSSRICDRQLHAAYPHSFDERNAMAEEKAVGFAIRNAQPEAISLL